MARRKRLPEPKEKNSAKTIAFSMVGLFGWKFVIILVLVILLLLVIVSMMGCATTIILEDVFGIPLTQEDEDNLKTEWENSVETYYVDINDYFKSAGIPEKAAIAQSFFIMYRYKILERPDYLQCLESCFSDGVKQRTMQRIEDYFGITLSETDYDVLLTYTRDNYMNTTGYKPYKNGEDLARMAELAFTDWGYYPNTYGQILSFDKVYDKLDDAAIMDVIGRRTVDELGILKAYAWLDKDTGDIVSSDTNAAVITGDTAETIFQKGEGSDEIKNISISGESGMGVYDSKKKSLGIYTGDGFVVFADADDGSIKKESVDAGSWDFFFRFSGIGYDAVAEPEEAELNIVCYSSTMSEAYLGLYGAGGYDIPLYFVDGKAEILVQVIAGDYKAVLQWMSGGVYYDFTEADYGGFQEFAVDPGAYYDIEYFID